MRWSAARGMMLNNIIAIMAGAAKKKYITATGGTITRDGNYLIHTFTGSDNFIVSQLASNPADNLLQVNVVAGGGGGGVYGGGGAGAGGFIQNLSYSLSSGVSTYACVIGSGGNKATSDNGGNTNGNNSSFDSLIAFGGGRGGSLISNAQDGGSGAGAGGAGNAFPNIGNGTAGQGFNGGTRFGNFGGGGGGASSVGANAAASVAGRGGNGLLSSITSNYYAGGGGGSCQTGTFGSGGTGGGGSGELFPLSPAAQNGSTNTGGGGGGSLIYNASNGGNGGSGIVIVKYYSPLTIAGYTLAFYNTVVARGGSLTSNELNYLNTFEASVGSDLAEFDRLWIHGLSNNIAARTSFVNPSSTIVTAVNSPTFTPSVGYQGNGSTSYLTTNYNPFTEGVKYTLNNASAFVYVRENIVALRCAMGAFTGGNTGLLLYPQYASNQGLYYINNNSPDNLTTQNSVGLSSCIRTSTTNTVGYKNGVISGANARVSNNMPNTNIFILGQSTAGTIAAAYSGTVSASGLGSSNYNQLTFYNAVQALGTSIGWAV